MKKLTRRMSFNDYADKAAANWWRSSCWLTSKWRHAPDSKVLAKIRMRNQNLDGHGRGYACPTFRQPTNCKSGFFNVLLDISKNPGEKTKFYVNRAGVKSLAQTLRRLSGAGLVECSIDNHNAATWNVTDFGTSYLVAAFNEFEIS